MKHVYNYNAIAVIVYNDRDSQNLDKMQLLDKERKWPTLFLSSTSSRAGRVLTLTVHAQSLSLMNQPENLVRATRTRGEFGGCVLQLSHSDSVFVRLLALHCN